MPRSSPPTTTSVTSPASSIAISAAATASSSTRTMPRRSLPPSTAASPGGAAIATTSAIRIGTSATTSHAVRKLARKAKRIGIEFDHVNLDFRQQSGRRHAGCRIRRHRRIVHAPAHDQVGRRDRPHHRNGPHCRYRRRGLCARRSASACPNTKSRFASTGAMVREIAKTWPRCRIDGHLDLVPVRHQHRRRP